MRQVYQAYARTCDILTHTFFFLNSQLHAIFGAFYSRFLVKVHASVQSCIYMAKIFNIHVDVYLVLKMFDFYFFKSKSRLLLFEQKC